MNACSEYTDNDLLAMLSDNDVHAFDELYNRYWEELYSSAFIILGDREASKDIVQNIFIWLWENRDKNHIRTLQAYLKVAVKFKVANYIRSGRIRQNFIDEALIFHPAVLQPSPQQQLELKELKTIMQLAVNELPEKCQEIFRLSREEHLSNREIAQRLDISTKTVENQMTIAFRRIKSTIELQAITLFIIFQFCENFSLRLSQISDLNY